MNSEEVEQIWASVCARVKGYGTVDATQIEAFFSRLHPQVASEGFFMLTADNDFIKTWIERNYVGYIKQALEELHGVPFTVIVEVDPTAASSPSPRAEAQPAAGGAGMAGGTRGAGIAATGGAAVAATVHASTPLAATAEQGAASARAAEYVPQTPASAPPQPSPSPQKDDFRSPLDARPFEPMQAAPHTTVEEPPSTSDQPRKPTSSLTFENFVIGDSNRMAYSMAVAVAEAPGKPTLNPLFIYGRSGLGKTHLMRAIQNYIDETMPHLRTIYVDSADLLSDYMEASAARDKEKSSYKNFKTRYEEADVLLIDDVQRLQGKKQTLDIVFQIFNKLTSQGRQVVLAADRAPKNIDIDERYISRFNSGGTFDIQPPEVETKLGIVREFIEEYRAEDDSVTFDVPMDIQMYIAENSSSNIRELKSAVTKVIQQMIFFDQPNLTLEEVRRLLENHFTGGPSKRLTIADVQHEVEAYYKVSHAEIIGKSRVRNVAFARHVAIYLCRTMLGLPHQTIGDGFGKKDHSTVINSIKVIEQKMRDNRELVEEIETIRQLILDR